MPIIARFQHAVMSNMSKQVDTPDEPAVRNIKFMVEIIRFASWLTFIEQRHKS